MTDFKPDDGGLTPRRPRGGSGSILGDIERIESSLAELIQNSRVLEAESEAALRELALTVGDFDERLVEAHNNEWPEELGDKPRSISFPYYKTLRLKSTTSSAYIRRKYEEGARDVTGNSAIDVLCLTDIIKKEALLIQNFLNEKGEYIGAEAEQRVLANFEIWVQSALSQTRHLYEQLQEEPSTQYLSRSESAATTPAEARRSQAVLKVSLNGLNDSLTAELNSLKRNFTDHAGRFYSDFLAPAVEAYGAVESAYSGTSVDSKIADDVLAPRRDALLNRLTMVLEDQSRRQRTFKDKMRKIRQIMRQRDLTRNKIWGLQETGRRMPVSGPAIMTSKPLEAREVGYWREEEEKAEVPLSQTAAVSETPNENTLTSDHSKLTNLLDPSAHPQYLLKEGGTVSGPIKFGDDATIDGMRPSEHRHTGIDGTPQLRGEDIIEGTIPPDRIEDVRPLPPTNFRISGFSQTVIPPGVTAIDVTLAWEGDDKNTYELEHRRL